ncbi:MAG: trehalose-phosphatase [Candidatus Tectomicrobia bacterium RIFCSPLOWO2_12_FULL_69_37]|nr:MAG: trehalose-phosphatase [Candidatus Tectomicrobia bacterium RIFCSPLOWO2_12_FULL_69_37]
MKAAGAKSGSRARGELKRFFTRLAGASSSLLLLDYDGTLAPFQEDPALASPYAGVTDRLRAIRGAGRVRVVVITGRAMDSILPLLGAEPFPEIWASHGRERRLPGGEVEYISPSTRQLRGIEEARQLAASAGLPGWMEEKPFSLAYHVRPAPPSERQDVLSAVGRLWRGVAEQASLERLPFDCGLELRPLGWTKGDAMRALLQEAPPDAPAAYLGDDETDEDAFRAIEGRGLSVLVRKAWRPTAARAWLRPPAELLRFLDRWRQAAGSGRIPSAGAAGPRGR